MSAVASLTRSPRMPPLKSQRVVSACGVRVARGELTFSATPPLAAMFAR